jgi:hypothetical protein
MAFSSPPKAKVSGLNGLLKNSFFIGPTHRGNKGVHLRCQVSTFDISRLSGPSRLFGLFG